MAITGTDYSVKTDNRDSLVNDMSNRTDAFSSAVGGNYSAANGPAKVGITTDMVSKIRTAYETYISEINAAISKIENPEVNQAFKGTAIEYSFQRLVTAVKGTAQEFTSKLKEAEMQIIRTVQEAYASQDSTVAQNINNDTNSLSA